MIAKDEQLCGMPWISPKQCNVHCLGSGDHPACLSSSLPCFTSSPLPQNAAVWRWYLDLPKQGWITASFHAQPTCTNCTNCTNYLIQAQHEVRSHEQTSLGACPRVWRSQCRTVSGFFGKVLHSFDTFGHQGWELNKPCFAERSLHSIVSQDCLFPINSNVTEISRTESCDLVAKTSSRNRAALREHGAPFPANVTDN